MTEYRCATDADYENIIEMANHAFRPAEWTGDFAKDTGKESFFPRILPKLYQNRRTAPMHYIAVQDGQIVGVVGNFDLPTMVCGEELKVVGIGTVSTHPDHRREGHMLRLMDDSIEHAKAIGADYLVLGGQRQRYEHWGFGQAGVNPAFKLDEGNFRRLYGADAAFGYEFVPFREADAADIAAARVLRTAEMTHVLHAEDQEFNVHFSMGAEPFVIRQNGLFKGTLMYFQKGAIADLRLTDGREAGKVLNDFVKTQELDSLRVNRVAPDQREIVAALSKIAGDAMILACEMIRVLNYERTVRAFLKMACALRSFPDCGFTAEFDNGEKLYIGVSGGEADVKPADSPAEVRMENPTDAVNFLFGNMRSVTDYGVKAEKAIVAPFLPLPYYQPACDEI